MSKNSLECNKNYSIVILKNKIEQKSSSHMTVRCTGISLYKIHAYRAYWLHEKQRQVIKVAGNDFKLIFSANIVQQINFMLRNL